jgi:hypothetical protein
MIRLDREGDRNSASSTRPSWRNRSTPDWEYAWLPSGESLEVVTTTGGRHDSTRPSSEFPGYPRVPEFRNAILAQIMARPAADMKGIPFSRISDLVVSAVVLGGLAAGLSAGCLRAAAQSPQAAIRLPRAAPRPRRLPISCSPTR